MEHQGQDHEAAVRPERGEVALAPEHEPADGHPLGFAHGVDQQPVGALVVPVGHGVVAGFVVDRIDRRGIDELLDVDRPTALGRELLQFLAGDGHIAILGHLEPLDHIARRDRLWHRRK